MSSAPTIAGRESLSLRHWRAWLLLAPAIPIDAFLLWWGPSQDRVAFALVGVIFAQVGLVLLWSALSEGRYHVRLAGMLVAFVATTLLFRFEADFGGAWRDFSPYFPTALTLQTILVTVGVWRMRRRGWRLVHRADCDPGARPAGRGDAIQFSLRTLWGLVTVASLALMGLTATYRMVHDNGMQEPERHILFAMFGISAAAVTMSLVWAVLIRGRIWLRIGVPLLVAAISGITIEAIVFDSRDFIVPAYTVSRAVTMGLWLLLAVALGYRLVKEPPRSHQQQLQN